jgi:hypothetical protein
MTQIHRDMQGACAWYSAEAFVSDALEGAESTVITHLAQEWNDIVAHPNLFVINEETLAICARLDAFCDHFFHTYQDLARSEVISPKDMDHSL